MLAAIIQSRMGSSRLPGKTLADVAGKSMLERLLERIQACPAVEDQIIATTVSPQDDVLADFSSRKGWKLYRGDEQDVLDRIYQAARHFGVQDIVRVTPDCPLLDPEVLDQVLNHYQAHGYDYVSNTQGCRFPDGLDAEVFSFKALETAWQEAVDPSEREHVTPYIVKRPHQFRIGRLEAPEDYSRFKWSVDTTSDLAFVRAVYERLDNGGRIFLMGDVLKLLSRSPELLRNESESVVNEGYYRSLAADAPVAPRALRMERSRRLLESALRLIPGGSQTFSKGPTQFVQGASPAFLIRGKGCRVWDADGNEYVDCAMALGSIILGYGHPAVEEAVRAQIEQGVNFSLPHPLEADLAEALSRLIPSAQMVRFAKNGSDATAGAVRLARAHTGRDLIACCYDEQTEILTSAGFKQIKQVRSGETVATLNPRTGVLEYQRVLETFAHPFDGNMLLFESKRLSLCVTPDHRVYRGYKLPKGPKTFRLVEARQLRTRHSPIWMTCASRWHCASPETLTVPRAQVKGWKTKGVVEFPTAPFLRFLGWYLAEGSVTIRESGRPGRYSHYRISLAPFDGRDGLVERMNETIRILGFTPRREGHHITFDSKELALYLKDLGHAHEKRVFPWVKELSPDLLEVFLNALVDGDGTRSGGRIRFYTSSKILADDVQELALKTGRAAYVAEGRNVGFSPGKAIYHVTINQRTTFECKRVRPVPYRGMVYCVRVPNGIVLVRRKGRCVWSGNSGYHGWQDWYIGTTTRRRGVPSAIQALTRTFEYNRIDTLGRLFHENPGQIAAVILEPVGIIEPEGDFLQEVQSLARREGALLIFDEVLTGFRFSLGGAQAHFGITPDLACFGKALANGFPLSAVVGRKDVMRLFEEVFFSFTCGGEVVSMAVALATLHVLEKEKVIPRLWAQGRKLRDGYNVLARHYGLERWTGCEGLPPRTVVQFRGKDEAESLLLKSYFQQECLKRGLLFTGAHNPGLSHTDAEVDGVLHVYRSVLEKLSQALSEGGVERRLEGQPVQPVFRAP